MTAVNFPTTGAVPSAPSPKVMKTQDFLRLLSEQLKQQDPFAPQDNTQMIAQMAQMTASSATAEMSATLTSIQGQIAEQTKLLGTIVAKLPTTTGV